ncbi:DUF6429 family protein [Aliifodinibius sp. S!AR15-10]|uniref:DUF6429 family protein n=1 Tax=Aliifodinibius sp. S!AR15-10 TaxID=2950437 RepID=UPI002863F520|nr:DUF6429 family protein [Aliifodinibius sp. S!AR15-10]MDR8393460.1 DUF6429 family protein [Aliifodinibius sp. S!AR15-10]
MEYDKEKADEMVLALLWLTVFEQDYVTRAWKGHSWEHLDRLHEKGFISDPKNKNKSVVLTEEGEKRSEELFNQYFGIEKPD